MVETPSILAIQSLLHMQQLDLPSILELIKTVPDVSGELARSARESLAVTILEKLCASNGNSSQSHAMDVAGMLNFMLQRDGSGDEISGGARRKLVFLDDDISEDNSHVKSLAPANNRLGEIEIATNCELQSCQQCRAFEETRKRIKTLFLSFSNKRHELSALASSSRKGPDVHLMEESKWKEGNCANNDIDPGVVFQFQQPIPYAYFALEDMSTKDDAQHDAMGKENYVHLDKLDVTTDIAMTKTSFLSLQGIDSQDSLGTQLNSYVKCNKGGNLLSCSSRSCPVVVHEECLGSAIDLDRMRIFYCPFCAYARSISQYVEAKKKFSLARTDLTTFYGVNYELANNHESLGEDI